MSERKSTWHRCPLCGDSHWGLPATPPASGDVEAALTPDELDWLPRLRLIVDSGDYVAVNIPDTQRLLDIIDRLDRRLRRAEAGERVAEARAAALDEARAAVDNIILADHYERVSWRRLQLDALAAIDALRERSGE